ncbi:MAG: glycosyl hydrolase family 79 C-terminal domain-containing protein [Chthoniobacter sp.]|uniref:glycosyl hydrolase family 79 C-terminal domain-containing protein n=1 Tax=Chthoniobacter sp. TaxID=2510640 RepID=UPI0032A80D5D
MKPLLPILLACVAAAVHAQSPTPTERVRLQVDPQTVVAALPDDFIGFGYETSALARVGFFSAGHAHLIQLYRTLGPHGLVRIGGIIGDHTHFEPQGTPVPHTAQDTTVINRAVLADLGAFLRATGWQAMWTLNLGTGSKEEAAEEALAVQAALGDRLHSFEIGNEVDMLKKFDGYASYHAAYLEYKAAVRAALPGAVFSGPDSAANMEWSLNFARTEARDMRLLIHHYYRGGARSPEATIETLLGPHPAWDTKLQKLHDACAGNGIAFRINEVNSFFGGGKPGVSDTFASALWCLDYMFRVASYGGAGVNLETDVNQIGFVSHYSPIFRDESGDLSARPEYYGMLAFSLAGHGSLVKLTTSEHALNLTAYATQHPYGALWITIINKDLALAANVELTLPEGRATAEAFRLTAPSAQSKSDVTLAGAPVAADGTWTPHEPEKISVVGRIASFPVPAASAVLVRLR